MHLSSRFCRALLAVLVTVALLQLAGSLFGCKSKPRVNFIRDCDIHVEPNTGTVSVGKVRPGRPYEIIDRKEDWYRIEVFENGNWGWTNCPTE